ncbi:hypothetical protein FRC08_011643 [Ceratobasidium sp. 394]|nr:hypothetical protein FRC08_011643 [Ceratobasidium sp. 394]
MGEQNKKATGYKTNGGYQRHAPQPESKSFLGGLFVLNARPGKESGPAPATLTHSSSSRPTPRRADTVTVLHSELLPT